MERRAGGERLRPAAAACQWVATRTFEGAPRYVVGTVDQRTFGLSSRVNYTVSPTLSMQVYAQPFVGAARYSGFKEVVQPRADRFDHRFRSTLFVVWNHSRAIGHPDGSFDLRATSRV